MTEIEVSAKTTAISGAAMYSGLYTCGGVRSSFRRNLMPSAAGCNSPNGPTRLGPQRFCMWPTTLRSSHTVYATAVSKTTSTTADLITDARMKSQMGNAFCLSVPQTFKFARRKSVCCDRGRLDLVTLHDRFQGSRVTSQST